jgi:hypothetical protein
MIPSQPKSRNQLHGTLRPAHLAKLKNYSPAVTFLSYKKEYKDLDYFEYAEVVEEYYKLIEEEILNGKDYYLLKIGYIGIRFQKRKSTKKIRSYYTETHAEFLDEKVKCILLKSGHHGLSNKMFLSFKAKNNLVVKMINAIVKERKRSLFLTLNIHDNKFSFNRNSHCKD